MCCKAVCFSLYRWNQLDIAIVALSIMGITLEELKMNAALPINPTIIRIMRVLRIARGDFFCSLWCKFSLKWKNKCLLSLKKYKPKLLPAVAAPLPVLWYSAESLKVLLHSEISCWTCCCVSAVLKLLKMATGMRALLDTVMQALPQVDTDSAGPPTQKNNLAFCFIYDFLWRILGQCGDLCGIDNPLQDLCLLMNI